jgi:hypothetical protein
MAAELCKSLAWWRLPVFSALGRLKQEDREFKVSLGSKGKLIQKLKGPERVRKGITAASVPVYMSLQTWS